MNEPTGYAAIPTMMLEDERLTASDCMVYQALASYLGCVEVLPSHAVIAKRARVNVSTVKRSLTRLKELGFVEWVNRRREDGGQTSNVYRLITPWSDAAAPLAHSERPPRSEGATPSLTVSDEVSKSEVPKRRGRRTPETPLPEDWQPQEKERARALAMDLDLEMEVERFRNHAEEHDRRCVNWDAAFRNWLIGSKNFTRRPVAAAVPSEGRGWM